MASPFPFAKRWEPSRSGPAIVAGVVPKEATMPGFNGLSRGGFSFHRALPHSCPSKNG